MVVAVLSAAYGGRHRAGAAERPVAGPPFGPATSNSLRILPSRSIWAGENPSAASAETSLPAATMQLWQFVPTGVSHVGPFELPQQAAQPLYQQYCGGRGT